MLSVSDGTKPVETVVGEGSRVTIGADTYDVVSVTDSKVVLRRAKPLSTGVGWAEVGERFTCAVMQ